MSEELKPCPFCGSEQVTTAPNRQFDDCTWVAMCKACGSGVERDLEAEAIATWNTRVVDHETGNMSDNDLIERVAQTLGIALARDVERDVYAGETCIEERRCIAASLLPVIRQDRQATRAALVSEIVAWLRESFVWAGDSMELADKIEAKWGKQ